VSPPIHDSFCWDRGTLKRLTLHRKKLGPQRPNFPESQKGAPISRNIHKIPRQNDSFLARPVWQGLHPANAGCHGRAATAWPAGLAIIAIAGRPRRRTARLMATTNLAASAASVAASPIPKR
jgi:hypothetical protein